MPGLLYTLISEPQLDKEGYEMRAKSGKRSFYKDGVLKFTATLKDGTYQLDLPTTRVCAVADAKLDNRADLWHFRLGHCNYQDMRKLRDTVPGISFPNSHKLSFCDVCVQCKMKQAPFLNSGDNCDRPRQILGFDVTGPYPKSAEGFAYCLDVICYYSGKNWSIPIWLKAEAYGAAKSLLTKMQNADRPPEGLEIYNSDHGGDVIMSNEFKS